jgi:membrane fusion protein (multidrug efflux system)
MNRLIISIACIATAPLLFTACSGDKPAPPPPPPVPHVQLVKVAQGGVDESFTLPAQLAAFLQVSIFPKVNGYVQTILVDVGSHVKTGQLLMVLTAPELDQASVQAQERFARSKSDFTISKEEYERLKEAAATPGAVSPLQLAAAKAKMDADSSLSNAERANWDAQKTMSSYLRVYAPFDGVITIRNVHPGALVSAEDKQAAPMLELKQISHLRLQVDIPENIAADLRQNDSLGFYLSAYPGKLFRGRIARKSDNINLEFRSERVELDVYNPDEKLAPGMYANVVYNSKGNPNAMIVPRSAVVTSTERKYVIAVRNGVTQDIDVSTGNQSPTQTEVFGNITTSDSVVVSGNDEIKEGTKVN